LAFLRAEWEQVVDAWQLTSWEDYRDVLRLGRKTRLSEKQRKQLWSIFSLVRSNLEKLGQITMPGMFGRLTTLYAGEQHSPYDFCIIDEAQDIEVGQLCFMAALFGCKENGLFFTGDLGQRIFQTPFSWKAAGVDVRGRSKTLRINYRTSHQIRAQADRLLDPEFSDVDGNTESRRDAQSVFNGPDPVIFIAHSPVDEIEKVGEWLRERTTEGMAAHEIAVFVRSVAEMDRAVAAATKGGLSYQILDKRLEIAPEKLSLATMHLAKGLEFRAVAVMACDEEIIPMQSRLSAAGESADLEEIYNTERQLLYVAITRARDHLLVSSGGEPSEFLDDLQGK
jgi:superfamily I DNA/RNA helicase